MLLERAVVCFDCKSVLTEPENMLARERRACPTCGSRDRAVQVVTAGHIRSLDDLRLDFQNERGRNGAAERTGPNAIETAQLVVVQREFSADRDHYIEHVEDEATGTVLWHLESPLSAYRRGRRTVESRPQSTPHRLGV